MRKTDEHLSVDMMDLLSEITGLSGDKLYKIIECAESRGIDLNGKEPYSTSAQEFFKIYDLPKFGFFLSQTAFFNPIKYQDSFPNLDSLNTDNLNIAKFIQILDIGINNGNEIKVQTRSKNTTISLSFKSEFIKNNLKLFLNTLLDEKTNGLYQLLFDLDYSTEKEGKYSLNKLTRSEISNQFIKPYSKEDLSKIVDYELNQNKKLSDKRHQKKIPFLNNIVQLYIENGIFQNDLSTISTKDAAFLYEVLEITGMIQEDLTKNDQEKYQFIKVRL